MGASLHYEGRSDPSGSVGKLRRWIYDPNKCGIQMLDIRSRDPFSRSTHTPNHELRIWSCGLRIASSVLVLKPVKKASPGSQVRMTSSISNSLFKKPVPIEPCFDSWVVSGLHSLPLDCVIARSVIVKSVVVSRPHRSAVNEVILNRCGHARFVIGNFLVKLSVWKLDIPGRTSIFLQNKLAEFCKIIPVASCGCH